MFIVKKLLFSIFVFVLSLPSLLLFGNNRNDKNDKKITIKCLLIGREDALDTLSSEGRKIIIEQATKEIRTPVIVVTNKKQCITGDKHNYESLSSYYWPNPDNPQGAYVSKDGYVNPETLDYDREKINKMARRCMSFAKAYYYSRDKFFYESYLRQINAWFVDKKTRMTPNMEYSQIIKGKYNNQGQAHGIIDAYALSKVLESIRLVEEIKPLPKRTSRALKEWFVCFSEWLRNSEQGKIESRQPNNHCPYYYSLLTNISFYVDDKQLIDKIVKEYPDVVLKRLIKEDGSQPGELIRTRAYHYSSLTLSAIVDFCFMMDRYGVNFYGDNMEIIDKGFSYLLKFADNKEAFPAKEIGDWNYTVSFLESLTNRIKSLEK